MNLVCGILFISDCIKYKYMCQRMHELNTLFLLYHLSLSLAFYDWSFFLIWLINCFFFYCALYLCWQIFSTTCVMNFWKISLFLMKTFVYEWDHFSNHLHLMESLSIFVLCLWELILHHCHHHHDHQITEKHAVLSVHLGQEEGNEYQ